MTRLREFLGFDEQLRPLTRGRIARRRAIAALQRAVAREAERSLPADERRQVIDLRSGAAALAEMAVACAIAAPVAVGIVLAWMGA